MVPHSTGRTWSNPDTHHILIAHHILVTHHIVLAHHILSTHHKLRTHHLRLPLPLVPGFGFLRFLLLRFFLNRRGGEGRPVHVLKNNFDGVPARICSAPCWSLFAAATVDFSRSAWRRHSITSLHNFWQFETLVSNGIVPSKTFDISQSTTQTKQN